MNSSRPFRRDTVHSLVGPLKCPTAAATLAVVLVAIASPALLAGLIAWALWPRRKPTSDELAAIECAKLDRFNETILRLQQLNTVARDVMLAEEAANLTLPHTFTPKAGAQSDGRSFTLYAIDLKQHMAHVSPIGGNHPSGWVHTDILASAIDLYGYQLGDITFSLIEQIERPKK